MTRRRVTDEQFGKLTRRQDELRRRVDEGAIPLEVAMDGLQRLIGIVTVQITVGDHRSTEELLKAGKFTYLNQRILELCPTRSTREPGTITLEEIEFDHDWTFDEGLSELNRRGLRRMEWDDLPLLCEQCPDRQRKRWVVSSMEPIAGLVLFASGGDGNRRLSLAGVQDRRGRHYRLLGVRE
jgi:hypothetical protein